MSIDWITVAAQIANFLVLVWLLKRFLYRPILDGIDAREAEITARMQEAEIAKEKAREMEQTYRDRLQALEQAQADLTETIRKKAEEQRDLLLAEANKRLEQERAAWIEHQKEEARKYTATLQRAGAEALLALTRKALTDLADETLEGRMAQHLARQISQMTDDLSHAAGTAAEAVVSSHAPLPQAAQDDLRSEVQKVFPKVALRFETDPDQAPGVILRIGGAQLAWTVESYIDGLEALIEEQLADGSKLKVQHHGQ
jgi:F-type H+-transporting ATPase subunit b